MMKAETSPFALILKNNPPVSPSTASSIAFKNVEGWFLTQFINGRDVKTKRNNGNQDEITENGSWNKTDRKFRQLL